MGAFRASHCAHSDLNLSAESVRKTCVRLGIRLRRHPKPHENGRNCVSAAAAPDTWVVLAREAEQRGVSVSELARHLLQIIAPDTLFDAVLDPPVRMVQDFGGYAPGLASAPRRRADS